ncbi:ATP-dependent nuclease [Romboutsia sp. Marseille-P6047]|uniref:ATP-dependent nuclease n=1 Tax=Romboutsia sp. Marseille-P6047 TaxID=2161817 RepID=UPI000F06E217|nr:AAA family ATPase [Romboutsia sp. Marseille-P6047]
MINSLEINDFRIFKNSHIKLGKHITAIAGKNGIGKSTILALLGNSCELKSQFGKTIFNTAFRTEFSEIFKASKEFDKSGSNKCKINFSNLSDINKITESKICRVTWQKDRFRVIPETKGENGNSRKKESPSLYLGLSRLFPVGEANDDGMKVESVKLSEDEKIYFMEHYRKILNLNFGEECDVDFINLGETKRKKSVGITTSTYSSITNSAGQDNIGQIILSVLSFKRLYKSKTYDWNGGILLIDELDATLHPHSQIKLVDYLYSECKSLNIQVVFTTHSTTLLKYISTKTLYNKPDIVNNYEIVYITKSNGPLNILQNPSYFIMKNDLNISSILDSSKQINVYSEDSECRWLFKNLIGNYNIYINPVNIQLGCEDLLRLNKADPAYFSNIMFVLDGDVEDKKIKENNKFGNIIKLPGKVRPEELIYDFLINLDPYDQFWTKAFSFGFNKESLMEYGPHSNHYQGKDRERFKQWFNDNLNHFEILKVFDCWKEHNSEDYNKFLSNFTNTYNNIAKRTFSPIIQ